MKKAMQKLCMINKVTLLLAFVIIAASNLFAQKIITIPVTTKDNAMVLQTDKDNRLWIVHFGKKMMDTIEYTAAASQYNMTDANAGVYNSAYTPAGTWSLSEPALQVTHAEGNPSLDLKYVSSEVRKENENVNTTVIKLQDPVYNLSVTLFYKV